MAPMTTDAGIRDIQMGTMQAREVAWKRSMKTRIMYVWSCDPAALDPQTGLVVVEVFALRGDGLNTKVMGHTSLFYTSDEDLYSVGTHLGRRVGFSN